MRLAELSREYETQAETLRRRVVELEEELLRQEGEDLELERRIRILETMRRETAAIAGVCAHYYERGYYRNERYTVCGIKRCKRPAL